jgi:hypothetical protein
MPPSTSVISFMVMYKPKNVRRMRQEHMTSILGAPVSACAAQIIAITPRVTPPGHGSACFKWPKTPEQKAQTPKSPSTTALETGFLTTIS